MSTTKALAASCRDSQFVTLCKAVYPQLSNGSAQLLNERSGELQDGILKLVRELTIPNRYAGEEVESNYKYPKEYQGPKPLPLQINMLAKAFNLSPKPMLEAAERMLPTLKLPVGAEGWFAILSSHFFARVFPQAKDLAELNCLAADFVLGNCGQADAFYRYPGARISPECFRPNARTAQAWSILAERQKAGIWIVGGQFGIRHAGRSARRVREVMVAPEFGGYTAAAGLMLLTHPERLASYQDLWFDAPGDEFCPKAGGTFDRVPYFTFFGKRVEFAADGSGKPDGHFGSISLFLPQ